MAKDLTGEQYADLMRAFLMKDYTKVFSVLAKIAADNFGSSKVESIANMTPAQLHHRLGTLNPQADAAISTVLHILEGRPL